MPLGQRVMQKITSICREEIERAGASSCRCPRAPAELWAQGPRWAPVREIMFRVDVRATESAAEGARVRPGPTHEEVITPSSRRDHELRDLPKTFFQIGTKFRNEIRRATA